MFIIFQSKSELLVKGHGVEERRIPTFHGGDEMALILPLLINK